MKKLVMAILILTTLATLALIGSPSQHCGCPAGKDECGLPCSSCCAPVCTFQPTTCEAR